MSFRTLSLRKTVGLSFVLCLGACAEPEVNSATIDRRQLSTDAFIILNAESIGMATSALRSIDSGDVEVARSTLKSHIETGLVVLKEMRTEKDATRAAMVDEAIRDAEAYLLEQSEAPSIDPAKVHN